MPPITFERRDPKSLRNHPINSRIYGTEKPDSDFVAALKSGLKLVDVLSILSDGTIISGHRRCAAAVAAGLKDIPCNVFHELTDDLDKREAVIVANCHRVKDGATISREAAELAEVESERATIRKKSNLKTGQIPEGPKSGLRENLGKTRDKVADHLGIGHTKAEEAIVVGKAIKSAEDRGDTAAAEKISEVARTKSIHAAKNLVSPPKPKLKPNPKQAQKIVDEEDEERAAIQSECPPIESFKEPLIGKKPTVPPVKRDNGKDGYFDNARQSEWRNAFGKLVRMNDDWLQLAGGNSNAEARKTHAKNLDTLSAFLKAWGQANPNGRWY